ncbi:MAG: pseudouridine synthase [Rickettsiaceae bacterium]|nr:pseudouridine synthase [Rickettsiaceae bacterium]
MLFEKIEDIIIYRDASVLVLNKPSGIAVHPGTGSGGNLEAYFEELRFGLPIKPALVHRLDKDTSGCLVLGRHPTAIRDLGKIFEAGKVNKTYHAIVAGRLENKEGVIDLPLGPQSTRRTHWWMKVDHDHGKPSVTNYKVLASNDSFTMLELMPITGRTHQLRVHCAAIGHPILGDKIYGSQNEPPYHKPPLYLHAYSIEVPLNSKKPPIKVTAELPCHMQEFVNKAF